MIKATYIGDRTDLKGKTALIQIKGSKIFAQFDDTSLKEAFGQHPFETKADFRYVVEESLAREADAIKCPCGGYAERVDCTPEEIEQYNCHRKYECCSRAFICGLCGLRIVGTAEAPEVS